VADVDPLTARGRLPGRFRHNGGIVAVTIFWQRGKRIKKAAKAVGVGNGTVTRIKAAMTS
jgi:hypothetical protein